MAQKYPYEKNSFSEQIERAAFSKEVEGRLRNEKENLRKENSSSENFQWQEGSERDEQAATYSAYGHRSAGETQIDVTVIRPVGEFFYQVILTLIMDWHPIFCVWVIYSAVRRGTLTGKGALKIRREGSECQFCPLRSNRILLLKTVSFLRMKGHRLARKTVCQK